MNKRSTDLFYWLYRLCASHRSWLMPVLVGGLMLLNAAPQESSDVRASVKTSKATDGRPSSISASAVAAPICASYTGLIPADASVTEWCIRIYSGT